MYMHYKFYSCALIKYETSVNGLCWATLISGHSHFLLHYARESEIHIRLSCYLVAFVKQLHI
jgi:hypothetical protein